MKKLGSNAYPFTLKFPPNAPSSVTLQTGEDDTDKPLGIEYNVKAHVADSPQEASHKRSSVSLTIKKVAALWCSASYSNLLVFLSPTKKYWDGTLKWATSTSFHIPSNSS
jgi:hypothetical protein